TGQPAGFALGLGTDEDDMPLAAKVLPGLGQSFHLALAALPAGVQPEHQGVGNVRVVVLWNIGPVLAVPAGIGVFAQAGLDRLFVVVFSLRLLLFLFVVLAGLARLPGLLAALRRRQLRGHLGGHYSQP